MKKRHANIYRLKYFTGKQYVLASRILNKISTATNCIMSYSYSYDRTSDDRHGIQLSRPSHILIDYNFKGPNYYAKIIIRYAHIYKLKNIQKICKTNHYCVLKKKHLNILKQLHNILSGKKYNLNISILILSIFADEC